MFNTFWLSLTHFSTMQQTDNVTIRLIFKCGSLSDEAVDCKPADTVWQTKASDAMSFSLAAGAWFLNFPPKWKKCPLSDPSAPQCHLLRAWPLRYPRARSPTDLRIIFLGKELRDDELVADLRARSHSDYVVVHLIVRERVPGSPGTPTTPTVHYANSPVRVRSGPLMGAEDATSPATAAAGNAVPSSPAAPASSAPAVDEDEEAEAHFHAVTVSERELTEFRAIFDKKKGSDGLIAVATVRTVLQSYWRFIHREGFEANLGPFPEERLEKLRRKVDASNGLTLDQFLTVFYLFDNVASEEPCVHGARERVRMATAQLHALMQPQHDFYHDKYEQLFALVCSDENQQTLTCKEMELLYYMYSAFVLERVREEELVARVQAIVRMKLQSSKYTKLVDAARTLQNCWRMRMFSADRQNHERVTEFLRSLMMQGQDKIGGPRV